MPESVPPQLGSCPKAGVIFRAHAWLLHEGKVSIGLDGGHGLQLKMSGSASHCVLVISIFEGLSLCPSRLDLRMGRLRWLTPAVNRGLA